MDSEKNSAAGWGKVGSETDCALGVAFSGGMPPPIYYEGAMKRYLIIFLILAGCSEEAAEQKQAPPADDCVGYLIRPNGDRDCVHRK